jgi:ribosome-associated translation inhibitor RaiA
MEIHWDDLQDIGEDGRGRVEERLRRLVAQHDDVLFIRIVGRTSGHHRHGGREVHITAHAKGKDITASRSGADLTLALHDAVDAFAHELRHLRERRSARPPERSPGPEGSA